MGEEQLGLFTYTPGAHTKLEYPEKYPTILLLPDEQVEVLEIVIGEGVPLQLKSLDV